MSLKKVIIILNPAASKDVPILALLNETFVAKKINWELMITKHENDAEKFAELAKEKRPDAIVVYGGDGMVTAVAAVLAGSATPLIILPAGTANVLAKELNIPMDIPQALQIFHRRPKKVKVDVSQVNKKASMLLRVEVGILANMVKNTQRKDKDMLGQLAYPLTALKELVKAKPVTYKLQLDRKKHVVEGIGLTVANVGNIGIPGISLQANMSCSDGKLDIFILQTKDLQSLIALGSSTLIGTEKPPTLQHFQAKKIAVTVSPQQTIISDDQLLKGDRFSVELQQQKLIVLV